MLLRFVDVLAGGEEISAVALGGLDGRLVHDALPSTTAVTELRAHSILHVFSDATQWRTGLLTDAELAALTPAATWRGRAARRPRPAHPRSTGRGCAARADRIRSYANIDARALGLEVDANVWMTVPPLRFVTSLDVPSAEVTVVARADKRAGRPASQKI